MGGKEELETLHSWKYHLVQDDMWLHEYCPIDRNKELSIGPILLFPVST